MIFFCCLHADRFSIGHESGLPDSYGVDLAEPNFFATQTPSPGGTRTVTVAANQLSAFMQMMRDIHVKIPLAISQWYRFPRLHFSSLTSTLQVAFSSKLRVYPVSSIRFYQSIHLITFSIVPNPLFGGRTAAPAPGTLEVFDSDPDSDDPDAFEVVALPLTKVYRCHRCHHINRASQTPDLSAHGLDAATGEKWYSVTQGKSVGVVYGVYVISLSLVAVSYPAL